MMTTANSINLLAYKRKLKDAIVCKEYDCKFKKTF